MGLFNRLFMLSGYSAEELKYEYYCNAEQLENLRRDLEQDQAADRQSTLEPAAVAAGLTGLATALRQADDSVEKEIRRYEGCQRDIEIRAKKEGVELADFDIAAYLEKRRLEAPAVRAEIRALGGYRDYPDPERAVDERPRLQPLTELPTTPPRAAEPDAVAQDL